MTDTPPKTGEEQRTPEEIRREIDHTREELGDTVEALAAKTDVKAQVKERVDEIKSDAAHRKDELLRRLFPNRPGLAPSRWRAPSKAGPCRSRPRAHLRPGCWSAGCCAAASKRQSDTGASSIGSGALYAVKRGREER
jgi:Protein of unknown function (DUF3618)